MCRAGIKEDGEASDRKSPGEGVKERWGVGVGGCFYIITETG